MHRSIVCLVCAAWLFVLLPNVQAQQNVVPAGTLIHCTMDEPNLSSKTVAVGDPVLCYLTTVQEFGKIVFPAEATCRDTSTQRKNRGTSGARAIWQWSLTTSDCRMRIRPL